MKPGRYNILLPQRATYEAEITLPIDLTGHFVYAQIWDSEKRRTKIADFDITVTDEENGTFTLELPWETTSTITKPAVWDLLVVYDNGKRDYWLEGNVTIDIGLTAAPVV
jgi:hypothetical protein